MPRQFKAMMRYTPQKSRAALTALAVSLSVIGAATPLAVAQDSGDLGRPQFFVTPYLWLSGVYATTQTPLERVPTVNSSVGPFEMLGHLEGAPFMGSAEIRDGPFGLLGDVLHVPVSTKVTTRSVLFQGGNVALATNTGTALVVYRVLSAPNQFADFGGGFRAWGFSANISLNPGLRPGVAVNRSAGWGDPLLAGRSLRFRQRRRPHRLWRSRRVRPRRAHRLAGCGHGRLRAQFVDRPSLGLSQSQR